MVLAENHNAMIDEPVEAQDTFEKELRDLLNYHSRENGSDTPDWILAEHLLGCLEVFDRTTKKRAAWYGQTATQSAADASRHRRNGGI